MDCTRNANSKNNAKNDTRSVADTFFWKLYLKQRIFAGNVEYFTIHVFTPSVSYAPLNNAFSTACRQRPCVEGLCARNYLQNYQSARSTGFFQLIQLDREAIKSRLHDFGYVILLSLSGNLR